LLEAEELLRQKSPNSVPRPFESRHRDPLCVSHTACVSLLFQPSYSVFVTFVDCSACPGGLLFPFFRLFHTRFCAFCYYEHHSFSSCAVRSEQLHPPKLPDAVAECSVGSLLIMSPATRFEKTTSRLSAIVRSKSRRRLALVEK
jgi:hypothetical protein